MKKQKAINVNLGCGERILEGWVNIDQHQPKEPSKFFVLSDIRELSLESNSVDYLLCDQVLEHLPMSDIPTVLHEIKRVLKVGGRAVICVPEFRAVVQQFLDTVNEEYFDPYLFKFLGEVVYGSQEHEGQFHRCPMTPGFMNYSLHMVGLHDFELVLFPALSPIPQYPGMPKPISPNARCRNAQLVADITK